MVAETAYDKNMSIRDWFAGQVLAGMHARDAYDPGQKTPELRAHQAYVDADAMIAERERTNDT